MKFYLTIIIINFLTFQIKAQSNESINHLNYQQKKISTFSNSIFSTDTENYLLKYKSPSKINNSNYLLILTVYQTIDVGWSNFQKDTLLYNENNQISENIFYEWYFNQYIYNSKVLYNYNIEGNLIEEKWERWSGIEWKVSDRYQFNYDENNNLIKKIYDRYLESYWAPHDQYIYTYDDSNNLTEEIYQYYNGLNWENIRKKNFIYDKDNKLIEEQNYNWADSTWMNDKLINLFYGSNSQVEEIVVNTMIDNNWVAYHKSHYTYDNSNYLINFYEEGLIDNQWIKFKKITFVYNNNYLAEEIHQVWQDSLWANSSKHSYNFDENNNKIEWLFQLWGNDNWFGIDRHFYSYRLITDIETNPKNIPLYSLSNNYPNPFNPITTINYSIPKTSFVTIKVFNNLGQLVSIIQNGIKSGGNHQVEFDGTTLPSGVYFYNLQTGNYLITKKMILLK